MRDERLQPRLARRGVEAGDAATGAAEQPDPIGVDTWIAESQSTTA